MRDRTTEVLSDMQKPLDTDTSAVPVDVKLLARQGAWYQGVSEEERKMLAEGVRILNISIENRHGIGIIVFKDDKAELAGDTYQGLVHLARMCEEALKVMSKRAAAVGQI